MTKDEQWLLDEKYGGIPTEVYEEDKARLASGEPLGYVIGFQPFLGLKIFLDSRPLIPRPETEWWTEQLLKNLGVGHDANERLETRHDNFAQPCGADQKLSLSREAGNERARHFQIKFLDLCAGSGAIGCAVLAKIPNAQVYFGEIDPAHKTTIEKNIRENNLDESRADIRTSDLFAPFADMRFDVIAINPPYIPSERVLDDSVTTFEPHQALFSGTDGLDLIRRIARELHKHLAPHGTAWVECDSSNIASAQALFAEQGFAAEIRTDQYGAKRLLVVSFPQ